MFVSEAVRENHGCVHDGNEGMSGETYAVHRILGKTSTTARFADWVESESEEYHHGPLGEHPSAEIAWLDSMNLGPAIRRQLLFPTGTACDVVRMVFQRGKFSRTKLEMARRIFEESGGTYPIGVEKMLSDLTEEFNAIADGDLIEELKVRANSVRTPEQAGVMVGEIDRIIERVRTKDRIATNIAMLAQSFDAALADQESRHILLPKFSNEVERLLYRALRCWCDGRLILSFDEEFTPNEIEEMRIALKISPRESVPHVIFDYFTEAESTQNVEKYLNHA